MGLKRSDGRLGSVGLGNNGLQVLYFDLAVWVEGLDKFETCIGFTDKVKPDYGILGFYGFLDRFDADFREDYFELRPRRSPDCIEV